MPYKPLPYGSREYLALRKTEKRRRYRKRIAGRACVIEHITAAGPGLWTFDGSELYQVETRGPDVSIPGFASGSSWEVVGSGPTEFEAIAAALARWEK